MKYLKLKKTMAFAMVMAMGMAFAGCGGEEAEVVEEPAETTEVETEETGEEVAGASVYDMPLTEAPDLSDTAWVFSGGLLDGVEMEQSDLDETLEMYGGTLQFVFNADGTAQMVQGGGTLDGAYEYLENECMQVVFDYNGSELKYGCVFADLDGMTVLMAMPDATGANALYFVQ